MDEPIICPSCGRPAKEVETRYGTRASCDPCGMWSWGRKPLVSEQVHEARKRCHAVFDPVWQHAEEAYDHPPENRKQLKKLRRCMRNRAYLMLSHLTGLPEAECHMSAQDDINKLKRLYEAALTISPSGVRSWYKREHEHGEPTTSAR